MFYYIIKYLYCFSFFGLVFAFLLCVKKNKYLIVTSLIFWLSFFYVSYIAFPCMFIEHINLRWKFSNSTITNCRLIVLFYNIFFVFYLYVFCKRDVTLTDGLIIKQRYDFIHTLCLFINLFGCIVIFLSCWKLFTFRKTVTGYRAYFLIRAEAEQMEAKYHLRTFLYFMISSSFYLFKKNKKLINFIPLLLIILFETFAGKRTTAFIVILYLYIIYAIIYRKLALKIIIPIFVILLIGILFTRAKALGSKLDYNIIFGEFFETFTTLPYLIDNKLFGFGFNVERILSDYTFSSFLPGFLKEKILSYTPAGSELAKIIGRGYGLGSNFIFEQLYEFHYFGFLTSLIIPLLLIYIDKKLVGTENIIIKIVFVFQLRLYVREGITQFLIIFYILILYFSVFYFFHKEIKYNEKKQKKHNILRFLSVVKEHKK